MDHVDDTNDASGLWAGEPGNARRPTRPPKDPLLSVTKLTVHSLEEFETALRGYLDNTPGDPEHAQCEIEVWGGVELLVTNTDSGHHAAHDKKPMSIADALIPQEDSKDTMKRQRAIAKCFIDSIQRTDGFRYAFHNNWRSGEDYRFSYYCNDSLLNKDRVANGKTGSHGKRAYKPVYDCKGVMAVKFSTTRQCVDVVYKHVPIHDTYEARAPPPRKDAKRRRDWELSHPDRVRAPQYIDQAIVMAKTTVPDPQQPKAKADKPPKKKKPKKSTTTAEADLREESMRSLLELIRGDEPPPEVPPAQPEPAPPVQPVLGRQSSGQRNQQPQQQVSQSTNPAGRPRIGCAICRAKRIKCDGAKPTCAPCRARVWPCFYIEPGSADDQNLPSSTESVEQANGYVVGNRHIPVDLTGDSSSGPNAQLANESLSTELIETKTELALLKDKLAEAEERLKQLESEKARPPPAPAPAPRRTPQVSGIRNQQNNNTHDDRPAKRPQSNNYNSMAYQMAQTNGQSYNTQQAPVQPPPTFAAQQPSHRQQRQPAYNTGQQQTQQQTFAQPPPTNAAPQPTYAQPQQTTTPQQQTFPQPQQTASTQQQAYVQPQQAPPAQQQTGVNNMYGQPVRWPPAYGYNMQQSNPYQTMNSRMR